MPYTFIGSLTWEFLCENNYPSINDFISTSIGGIALGEITHRLSYLVLDDSKRGLERAGREILAGLISPMVTAHGVSSEINDRLGEERLSQA